MKRPDILACPWCLRIPDFQVSTEECGRLTAYTAMVFCTHTGCPVSPSLMLTRCQAGEKQITNMVIRRWNKRP